MKIAPFWASIALFVPQALTESTATPTPSTTSTTTAPSCTASLITTLCSYPDPGPNFAVASDGKPFCWDYCNAHPPCSFVIFDPGNPYTGTGTCWLYPGETFDTSKGGSNCSSPYLSVYDQPVCAGGSATTTSGACAATATPSAIASGCGYPTPYGDCFYTCSASTGAPDCLSQCAKADSCNYVVFNPGNGGKSPYAPGSCWMYPNGTFDAGSMKDCSGAPEQFAYKNLCPKPSPTSTSATGRSTGTGTAGTTSGSTASAATESDGAGAAANTTGSTTSGKNSAPAGGLSLVNPLAIGVAVLIWQAI